MKPWLCPRCQERFPAMGRADGLCGACGSRRDRERSVASRSHSGESYRVEMAEDGTVRCTCSGFSYRGRCRHVQEAARS